MNDVCHYCLKVVLFFQHYTISFSSLSVPVRRHWTYNMLVRFILCCLCLRFPDYFLWLWGSVFSAYPFLLFNKESGGSLVSSLLIGTITPVHHCTTNSFDKASKQILHSFIFTSHWLQASKEVRLLVFELIFRTPPYILPPGKHFMMERWLMWRMRFLSSGIIYTDKEFTETCSWTK